MAVKYYGVKGTAIKLSGIWPASVKETAIEMSGICPASVKETAIWMRKSGQPQLKRLP